MCIRDSVLGVCIVTSLLIINSKFDFKTKYNQLEGYVSQYQKADSDGDLDPSTLIIAHIVESLQMKEKIGSPLVFAGLSVGALLIAGLLSFGEYFLLKKSVNDVRYESMILS